ncbi:MAG TPA: hypothetical protein VIH59_12300 [Candidatus Tectomicrobia bacterium]
MATQTPIAPGARIVVRDEEWLVRRVDPASDGGRLLTCDGVSDLVRGQASLFLTALGGPIEMLDPTATQLVTDPSPMFNAALLYNYLESAWWDIIVIDECHNVAARAAEQGKSRRARLAERLAGRSDTLILLSATPHNGSARSFASLMALLDPTAISDPDDYTPGDYRHKGLVIRRFKRDIRHQVAGDFKERRTIRLTPQASAAEEAAYRALLDIRFTQSGIHRGGKQQELQRVAMQKAIFSSPFAALESTRKRLQLLTQERQPTADELQEVADLKAFAATWRAGLCDAGSGAEPQGPAAAGRLAGGLPATRPAVHAGTLRCLCATCWPAGRPVAEPRAELAAAGLAGGTAGGGGPHAPAHGTTAVYLCQ